MSVCHPVVRAKLRCNSITPNEHRPGMKLVQFGAVWSAEDTGKPHDENALFGKLTPHANFCACMVDNAADRFVQGQDYYVDFTPVQSPFPEVEDDGETYPDDED